MIKEYEKKDGKKYWMFKAYLGIDPSSGKKIYTTRRGFKTQKEAKIAKSRLELQAQDNKYLPQNNITFGEVAKEWLKRYKTQVKESSYIRVVAIFKSNILPKLDKKKIAKISIPYCQTLVTEWYEKYETYKAIRSYTVAVFDYAIELRYINDNPMKHVPVPKKKKKIIDKKRFYEKEELELFLDCCEADKYPLTYPMFRLLAFSGIRKGELAALTWNDIDFEKKTLTVNKTVARNIESKLIVTDPKSYASNRRLSLDEKTISVLKKWRTTQKKYLLSHGINSLQPNQLIFSSKTNLLLDHARLNKLMEKICKANNIENINVHGLRHTHCSLLFAAGLSVQEVQDRLGHSSARTTLEIYSHFTKGQREQAAEKFAKYINF
jgi:integrase